jgi:hypothetical protein
MQHIQTFLCYSYSVVCVGWHRLGFQEYSEQKVISDEISVQVTCPRVYVSLRCCYCSPVCVPVTRLYTPVIQPSGTFSVARFIIYICRKYSFQKRENVLNFIL